MSLVEIAKLHGELRQVCVETLREAPSRFLQPITANHPFWRNSDILSE
jgi:hypothetical protein